MILVTGGTGLVGCNLLYFLISNNKKVIALKRSSSNIENVKKVFLSYSKNDLKLFNRINWIDGDINDLESLSNAFKNVSEVYHCAAFISFDKNDLKSMQKINVEGTANVINCAIDYKIKKLCYVSTIAAIGLSTSKFTDENTEWIDNKNPYSKTKKNAEMEVWRGISEGLNAVIVNPGVIVGSGFWKRGSGAFFTQISRGMNYYPVGKTGFICVKDVVKIMYELMDKNIFSERFILVAENWTFKKFFIKVSNSLNINPPKKKAGKILMEIALVYDFIISKIKGKRRRLNRASIESSNSSANYSNSKISSKLNYKFKKIEKSIEETCQIFKNQFN
ncbi:MAG: NAD-dependent epimerase [Flavobacteriaceae bacterium]|nr:NAD-dependent epimerase [Flavobacteriaceae bacterium]|tara:strand:+ start:6212 stop:7213 length:1002 start_codon:yes stop_codon:yes gene_type:complete